MADTPKLLVHEEQMYKVGEDTFVDSITTSNLGVVFEDDGEVAYFYAVEMKEEMNILDALHIYDVPSIIDREIPSSVKILWSEDLTKAFLSINDYYHAAFDFQNKAGYCRDGFPESNGQWTIVKERILTDQLLEELVK